jgi:dihydrofolate reductase
MATSVLYMSMSLDGFINGPEDDVERLHQWLAEGRDEVGDYRPSGLSGKVFDELMATGAVVVGRRTFDLAGSWNGDHHGVPIFVPTRQAPPDDVEDFPWVTYVTDSIESTMTQAREAAGDKSILVHGAETAQSCLKAGVLDELEIHLVPVLLGEGRLLFDHLGTEHIELELTRIVDAPGVTHLRYRVGA